MSGTLTELGPDPVERPRHYEGDGEVDCARAARSMAAGYDRADAPCEMAYWALAALKYVWRAPLKGGAEDFAKARECLRLAEEAGR